jgi:hypothetical protein
MHHVATVPAVTNIQLTIRAHNQPRPLHVIPLCHCLTHTVSIPGSVSLQFWLGFRSSWRRGSQWNWANKARGSSLTMSEPPRSQAAISEGLQDQGNFPIEMRNRCVCVSLSLPLSPHSRTYSILLFHPPLSPFVPPGPRRDMGGT